MGWRNRPSFIESCPLECDYIMFVDENGDNNISHIINCINSNKMPDANNIYFTVTGCIIHKKQLHSINKDITDLKNRYWENGCCQYSNGLKRVCLHSREIRRKEGPFNLCESIFDDFIHDLSDFLEGIKTEIISITINKYDLCNKYVNPYDPYNLSSKFLIERYAKFLLHNKAKGIIVLEKRGKDADLALLNHLKQVIDFGTGDYAKTYMDSSNFQKCIGGIYFNSKWCKQSDYKKSYFGLEITDLFSYPIHKYVRSGCKDKSKSYVVLEDKLSNYPDYIGYGLKIFPKK